MGSSYSWSGPITYSINCNFIDYLRGHPMIHNWSNQFALTKNFQVYVENEMSHAHMVPTKLAISCMLESCHWWFKLKSWLDKPSVNCDIHIQSFTTTIGIMLYVCVLVISGSHLVFNYFQELWRAFFFFLLWPCCEHWAVLRSQTTWSLASFSRVRRLCPRPTAAQGWVSRSNGKVSFSVFQQRERLDRLLKLPF